MGNDWITDNRSLVVKAIKHDDKNSTALIIPKEFARELQIENSKSVIVLD
jgi:hypothetical protein